MTMSLGEVSQVSEGVYAYLQPDGSWYLNNTGFLAGRTGSRHHRRARAMPRGHPPHQGTPAHTTNDSIIHLPERSVVFTGDLLFNGGTPFALQGSVSGWIEVLGTVLRPLGARTLVPGHGPVCGPEVIDDMLAYLRFVQQTARRAKAAGLSPLEAARATDLGAFSDLLDSERIVGNLHRAYLELEGADRGAPIDLVCVLGEMVAYNGGRPLSCHA
jgi:cyclase